MLIKFINTQHHLNNYTFKINKINSNTNNPFKVLLTSLKNLNYISYLLSNNLYTSLQSSYLYTYLIKHSYNKRQSTKRRAHANLANNYITNLI
jgi:hypothetical protein